MAIIARIREKGKTLLDRIPEGILTALVVILAVCGAFGLGVLAGRADRGGDISFEQAPLVQKDFATASVASAPLGEAEEGVESNPAISVGGQYVASKKGTKYHFPWCPGAKAMSEENKIWFSTQEEAEKAGYTKAANCKGL